MRFKLFAIAAAASLMAASTALGGPPDLEAGKSVFQRCSGCHMADASGKSSMGPNLGGVVGRPIGKLAGYKYSPALVGQTGAWDAKTLDAFLTAPAKAYPGNRMTFLGMKNPADRAAVIAYMATLKGK